VTRLASLRDELVRLHDELPRHGLVSWTGGNVSVRDPESGLVAIKPSGVRYGELTADSMVVLDLDGTVVEGALRPSSDTASHLYIYRHRPDINGVVHTHSRYATAFAAVGRSIPVYLTAQADEFGGEIPCAGFALIGDEAIGALVVEAIGRSPAVLLRNHGVFTIGPTAAAAVKTAVMVEDIAATVWLALQIGTPEVLPAEVVEQLHRRYTTVYGQPPAAPPRGSRSC
jgi:L-ribulose-5-phosphate 4-epimerase